MSTAETAYAAAIDAIDKARRLGITELILNGDEFNALESLPSEIADFAELTTLALNGTQVSDLAPVQGLTRLRELALYSTPVSDLTPVQDLTALELLIATDTPVADLAPLRRLTAMRKLTLSRSQVTDIGPLRNLTQLEELRLDGTRVADLVPLRSLFALNQLSLDGTQVADIEPLRGLAAMRWLHLEGTPIADLRPISGLTNLIRRPRGMTGGGVFYRGCQACRIDPNGLGRLAEIEDIEDRTHKTLEYLQGLTVWPPDAPNVVGWREQIPQQDGALRVAPNPAEGGRLDVNPGTPSSDEAAEQLKQRLYARLKTTLDSLARATGNQHYTITQRINAFRASLPDDLAEADMLAIYLELDWTRGIHDRRAERQGDDRLSQAAVEALHEIGTIGPGLVLGNAEVEDLEARRRRFELGPRDPAADAAQDELSEAIAARDDAFAPTLRRYAGQTAGSSEAPQRILNRNVLIALGTSVVVAPITGPIGNATYDALLWAVANNEIILAAARSFGSTYLAWLAPLLGRAAEIVAAVESSGLGAQARSNSRSTRD